ncbi:ABC transporter permease [Novipirellula sp. SH528]|uniref:ABC transporter permease n=1 Tax=Novipirellula sp. SH528 TaxID=3454466 RepID=UPI003FA124D9
MSLDTETDDIAAPDDGLPLRLIDLQIQVADRMLIRDTSLTIPAGKITVIVGASGAGKSVLLRTLAGLVGRDHEAISWQGNIAIGHDDPSQNRRPRLLTRVGIVFQQFALFDELSPTANVQFAIDHRSDPTTPPSQSAKAWVDELGVPAHTSVSALSGGQKQRLAIARTLAAAPDILLYDEPTSGLDSASGRKVAELIRHTQTIHRTTSIVVTHDYLTLLPIADEVLLLDSQTSKLVRIENDQWDQIPARMQPVALSDTEIDEDTATLTSRFTRLARQRVDDFFTTTGSAIWTAICLPFELRPYFPHFRWGTRFVLHYLRLVGGPSAWFYLILAGMIIGFTSTYFTFEFLPFQAYTQPLLIDELLASIGFALYRILVPVLATILIAARCGAAVAADVGVKRYGGQVDALQTLGVRPRTYLLLPIVIAFVIATPMLEWMALSAAKLISLVTFLSTHPNEGPYFWQQNFYRNLVPIEGSLLRGWEWVLTKNLICGFGIACIAYYQGLAPKKSANDVSGAITSTVLWTTLYVLVVHFVTALIEF